MVGFSTNNLIRLYVILAAVPVVIQATELFRPATPLNWLATWTLVVFIGIVLVLARHYSHLFKEAGFYD